MIDRADNRRQGRKRARIEAHNELQGLINGISHRRAKALEDHKNDTPDAISSVREYYDVLEDELKKIQIVVDNA